MKNAMNKLMMMVAVFVALMGAMHAQAATGHTAGYGAYQLIIPTEYTELGNVSVQVRLDSDVMGGFPVGNMRSTVFENDGELLLLQHMSVGVGNDYIAPLSGEATVSFLGKEWKKNTFSLNVEDATREFGQYVEFAYKKGVQLAENYKVEIFSHRIGRKSLVRVLKLTPGLHSGLLTLPDAQSLYTLVHDTK